MIRPYRMRLHLRGGEVKGMKQKDLRSDEELLLLIAKDRDEAAFAHLFQRYQLHAFNLSRYMTRDPELAQEAVQEAMLGIWFNAKSYRAGNARSWILNVVSKKSLNVMRGKYRKNAFLARLKKQAPQAAYEPSSAIPEAAEAVEAVREAIEQLDTSERQLVALHYGAGLSQREIAKELSIPQRTISDRLRRLLEKLRGDLQAKGLSPASPTIMAGSITAAVCTGDPVPPGLVGNVLNNLSRADARDFSSDVKRNHSASGRAVWILPVVFVAVIGAWSVQTPGLGQSSDELSSNVKSEDHVDMKNGKALAGPNGFSYEDGFDERSLNNFWITSNERKGVTVAAGVDHSQLILSADATKDASSKKSQRSQIISREIDLNGMLLEFDLDSGRPTGHGRVEYGIAMFDQNGNAICFQVFKAKSLPNGRYEIERLMDLEGKVAHITNPRITAGSLATNHFQVTLDLLGKAATSRFVKGKKSSYRYDKTGDILFKTTSDVTTLKIRIYVKAEPGSTIHWPINAFRLTLFPRTTQSASPH